MEVRYAPGIKLTRSVILKQVPMLMKHSGMTRKEAMKHAWSVGKGGPGYMWMPWTIAHEPAIIETTIPNQQIKNRYAIIEHNQNS